MPAEAQAMSQQQIRYAWENDLSGDRVVMLLTLTHQQFILAGVEQSCQLDYS
jgi:hypothetical protein